jgi:beta-N-acetylhexosaminidase
MNLAPVLDPSNDSRGKNSCMEESRRSWGNDATNAFKVRAFVKGMSENGVICVSKHFPGYDSWTNSDHQIAVSATPRAKIAKNVSFFKTLANDIPVTMMSSVSFVRISSRPAVFEPKIVKMARDMSPETVILTDDLWGVSLRAWISGNERVRSKNYPAKDFRKLVRTALMAGNDMFMITYSSKAVEMINYLAALSKQSKYYRQRIEESAARILKMKYRTGIIR